LGALGGPVGFGGSSGGGTSSESGMWTSFTG
jgi:hypothetical protein